MDETISLIEKAILYATKAHLGQVRKSSGMPMIMHPIRVAEILRKAGFEEEVIAAGYLHDTVEDTPVTHEDLVCEFGESVAAIVAGNTENKALSWEERKEHTMESIQTAALPVKALIVADKLDNLESLMEEYLAKGEEVWSAFKRGREQQAWYFRGVAAHCLDGLQSEEIPSFFYTYQQKVAEFFKET